MAQRRCPLTYAAPPSEGPDSLCSWRGRLVRTRNNMPCDFSHAASLGRLSEPIYVRVAGSGASVSPALLFVETVIFPCLPALLDAPGVRGSPVRGQGEHGVIGLWHANVHRRTGTRVAPAFAPNSETVGTIAWGSLRKFHLSVGEQKRLSRATSYPSTNQRRTTLRFF